MGGERLVDAKRAFSPGLFLVLSFGGKNAQSDKKRDELDEPLVPISEVF